MPSGNGFITYSPDTRYGSNTVNGTLNSSWGQKFLLVEGNWEVTEIGIYVASTAGYTGILHLGIFTNDIVNNCPGILVDGSDTGELSHDTTTVTKINHSYSVKPLLTGEVGGTYFWLCHYYGNSYLYFDRIATGGTTLYRTSGNTYPTWPTDTQWHTHYDSVYDTGIYAFYQPTSVGSKIVTGSMIHIG